MNTERNTIFWLGSVVLADGAPKVQMGFELSCASWLRENLNDVLRRLAAGGTRDASPRLFSILPHLAAGSQIHDCLHSVEIFP